jgi:hypothetical protein
VDDERVLLRRGEDVGDDLAKCARVEAAVLVIDCRVHLRLARRHAPLLVPLVVPLIGHGGRLRLRAIFASFSRKQVRMKI